MNRIVFVILKNFNNMLKFNLSFEEIRGNKHANITNTPRRIRS